MPKFRITAPDGRTFDVDAPEGATEQQALAHVIQNQQADPQARGAAIGRQWQRSDASSFGGLLRGGRDIVDAGAQMAVRGANMAGLVPDSEVQRVEDINKQAEQQYQQARGSSMPDINRAIGSGILGTLATPIRIGAAPTLLGRTGRAALAGGIGGSMTPVADAGDNMDFMLKKGRQTGLGAVTGAILQPGAELATEGLGRLAQSAANRTMGAARGLAGQAGDAAAEKVIREALGKQGIDFGTLGDQVKASLMDDVKSVLASQGSVNPSALARKADFEALGVQPNRSWITRDPNQWGQESNLAGIQGVGEELVNRRNQLDRAVVGKLNQLRGEPTTPYAAGQQAERALGGFDAENNAKANILYRGFREMAPNTSVQDPQRFAGQVMDALEGQMVGSALPLDYRNRLNDIATGKFPLTPSTLYELHRNTNQALRSAQGSEKAALGILKQQLDGEMASLAQAGGREGQQALQSLKLGQQQVAQRYAAQEAMPALKAVVDGNFAPEDFVGKFVINGDVRDVAKMWTTLDAPAKQTARAAVMQEVKKAAIGNVSDEAGVVGQSTFANFMEQPGMKQKLRVIVGDEGLADLQRIQRASEAAIKAPGGAKPNTSNTSQAIANLMLKTTGVPFLGPMVSQPLKDLSQQRAAAAATDIGPGLLGGGAAWNEDMAKKAQALAGLLGYTGTVGLLGELSR